MRVLNLFHELQPRNFSRTESPTSLHWPCREAGVNLFGYWGDIWATQPHWCTVSISILLYRRNFPNFFSIRYLFPRQPKVSCVSAETTRLLCDSLRDNHKQQNIKKMQQRKSTFGRPSGTDGSDYAYRMVVDSRRLQIWIMLLQNSIIFWIFIVIYFVDNSFAYIASLIIDLSLLYSKQQ